LDNEVTVTPACHDETPCEDYEKLEQTSFKSVGADTIRLWMAGSLPNGNTFSKEHIIWLQQQLTSSLIDVERKLSDGECQQLRRLLADYHDIFSLNDDESGETDLVEFQIDTGEAHPRRQPARRFPF